MSQDTPSYESSPFVEGLALQSLSDWLQVGSHYVNMSQAQCVDDDPDSAPPHLLIWLHQQTVTARGADRLAVLAWLAAQVAPPAGG